MTAALRVAIVGAESTGKSTLAQSLAQRLGADFGLRAVAVPEVLRDWCEARGRTPAASEQWDIARAQSRLIDEAAAASDVVVCDTTPLMTAVYSRMIFDDASLDGMARAAHATMAFTLLTALDLPWVADGLQRDGPHVRAPVDRLIRAHLVDWKVDWAVVSGSGAARATHALDALRPTLARWSRNGDGPRKLFSSLLASGVGPRDASDPRLHGACELCDRGDLEHLRPRG